MKIKSRKLQYKPLSNVAQFKKDAIKILGGYGSDLSGHREIYKDGKLIGYIGLEEYEGQPGDDFNRALGIGDFMILERGKGYGTEVIKDLVDSNKDKYDLIYCFVDANNKGAINLYKKLGKVYDEEGPNDNNQYYVTFWDKTRKLEALSREQFDDINPREYFCDILCEDWYGDNLLDYIKSNFNVSDYYSEGQSYILPDGEFLNLYDGAHIGVDDTLYEEGLIREDPYVSGRLVLMDDYNSIRVSDGKYIQTDPYIELPKKLPSNAQLSSLLEFLDYLEDRPVWVGIRDDKNVGASYNLRNILPEEVIKNIRRFYSSGTLYEVLIADSIFNIEKNK